MTRPDLLIIRSEPGASRTAARANTLGFHAFVSPLSEVEFLKTETDLSGHDAVVVTSGHAIGALADQNKDRERLILTVGDQTADDARALGYSWAQSARGDVSALLRLVSETLPTNSSILYPRGEVVTGDLQSDLEHLGYRVEAPVLYRMAHHPEFTEAVCQVLRSDAPPLVLIHSAQGARTFLEVLDLHNLTARLADLCVVGISKAAVKPLEDLSGQLHVSSEPSDEALLQTCLAITT